MSNLTDLICSAFDTAKGSGVYDHVFVYCLSYLTGGYTAFELQQLLKPYCVKMSAKEFRLKLLKHKRIHFGLKLFLLNLSLIKSPDFSSYKAVLREVDVDPIDARQAYRVWRDQTGFKRRLIKLARRVARNMDLSESYIQDLFTRVYPRVMSYVKLISFKKLRFVARSSNLDMSDLHSELMVKVVQAYYKLIPTDKSEAYVVNYLRRAAHNHAMNLIQSNTTQKRGRLVKVGTDSANNPIFSLTVISENQLNVAANFGEEVTYDQVGEEGEQMDKFELSFSVVQLLDRYKVRARKFRFLLILMGQDDEDFTTWLRNKGLCKDTDTNADVQLQVSAKRYLKWLCKFMHIGQDAANVFLLKVRKDLGFDYGGQRKAA